MEVVLFLLVFFGLVVYSIWSRYKQNKTEKPVREKIEKLRIAGQPLVARYKVSLTKEEAEKIRMSQSRTTWIWFLGVISLFIVVACILIFLSGYSVYMILIILFILIGISIVITLQYQNGIRREIAHGYKTVIRGVVTDIIGDSEDGYTFVIDKIRIDVSYELFKLYKLGDAVEFHVFEPYNDYVMYHVLLTEA